MATLIPEPRTPAAAHLPPPNYPRFHLAFPVTDLAVARRFYGSLLVCAEGRSSDFKGLPGEQATMYFVDPFGNALEFKAFADIGLLFAKNP